MNEYTESLKHKLDEWEKIIIDTDYLLMMKMFKKLDAYIHYKMR